MGRYSYGSLRDPSEALRASIEGSAAELRSMRRRDPAHINHIVNHISRSPGFLGIDLAKPGKDESVFFVSQHGKLEEYPMSNKLTPRDPDLYVSQIGETFERIVLVETTKKVRVEYCGTAKERERVTGLLKDTFNDLWLKADGQATIGDTFGNSTAGAHFTPGRKARFEVRGPFNSAELDALAQYASAFSLIEVEVK